jgi:hypothetical protein
MSQTDALSKDMLSGISIPQLFHDAIYLTCALKYRWLWIDALCMVQDDDRQLQSNIDAMDQIYYAAVAVVVIACGDGPSAGIPGITGQRQWVRTPRGRFKTSHNRFVFEIGHPLLSEQLKAHSWSSRAWTFQEDILASRKIYLTEYEAVFSDGFRMGSESGLWPEKQKSIYHDQPNLQYAEFVKDYTRHRLTFDSDIIRAYTGIYNMSSGAFNQWHKAMHSSMQSSTGLMEAFSETPALPITQTYGIHSEEVTGLLL